MDRRSFLKSTGAAAAATATTAAAEQSLAAPATSTEHLEIRTALGPRFQSGYLRDRADRLALRLREMSDGKILLALESSNDSGLDAVGRGTIDAYFGTEADHVSQHAAFAYVSALPGEFGLAPEHFNTWLNAGAGQMLWDEVAAEFGVKAFAAGHSGRRPGLWANAGDISLTALPSTSISTRGLAREVAFELGLDASATSADDTPDLLEPLVGTTAALTEMSRRIWYSCGINQAGVTLSFGLSRTLWDGLTTADQALINSVTAEAFHQSVAEHDAHDKEVAPHLFTARGIERRQLPSDVARAISHVNARLIAENAAQSTTVARIHESYMQFRTTVTGLAPPGPIPAAV